MVATDREAVERRLGLDVPVWVQYGRWMGGIFLRGTLGESLFGGWSVEERLFDRLPITLELGGMAILIGLGMSVRAEWKREVCLPTLTGRLARRGQAWTAHVTLVAGHSPVTLKGADADAPWRVPKQPKERVIKPGESVDVGVRLKVTEQPPPSVRTHWSVEVEQLGGWVLDLSLTPEESAIEDDAD